MTSLRIDAGSRFSKYELPKNVSGMARATGESVQLLKIQTKRRIPVASAIPLICCLCIAGLAHAQLPVVAYRGATVETMGPAGRLENATVVVRAGKIEAVGKDVTIPETARTVNANGKT